MAPDKSFDFPLISQHCNQKVSFVLYSKPTAEVLTEYSRKVDFLKGLLEAEKLVSVCRLKYVNLLYFTFIYKFKTIAPLKMNLCSIKIPLIVFALVLFSFLCFYSFIYLFFLFSLRKQKRPWPTSSWRPGEHPR